MNDYSQMFSNPFLSMGLGILSANKPGASFGEAVGGGGLLGMQNYQQQQAYQQQQELLKRKLAEEEAAHQQELARQHAMSQFFGQQDPRLAQLAQFDPSAAVGVWKDQAFPQPQNQDELVTRLTMAGYTPGTPQFQMAMRDYLLKPQVQVNQGPPAPPANYRWVNNDPMAGVVEPIPGGPAEKPTEGQLSAAGFADRMTQAEKKLGMLEQENYDPASGFERLRGLSNYTASPEYQSMMQAQSDWVLAKLRVESGGVIGPEEMAEYIRTYFPRPGDSKRVIDQKRAARIESISAMKRQSGPQYNREAAGRKRLESPDGWSIEVVE